MQLQCLNTYQQVLLWQNIYTFLCDLCFPGDRYVYSIDVIFGAFQSLIESSRVLRHFLDCLGSHYNSNTT
ncbi:hypothetical protein QVD17_10105 [Tagetes erecta]|uniref:Uncharacterized protein n=1 Tax=Tagetes erecta TaxID=13708 RepID=A0AAD8L788_TARER|nr:hypothetical protein QVD17_10105 [Tagetes erecta]